MAENSTDNSSDTATTTTTVGETTTTTTTADKAKTAKTTTTTTVDAGAAEHTAAAPQGEVAVDQSAKAVTTNDTEQTHEDRLAEAQADALRNHQVEHAHDDDENRSSPSAV